MESSPGFILHRCRLCQKNGVGGNTMDSLFGYLILWEGSPEPDSIGVWRRLLQSVFKGGMKCLFCEIAIFQPNLGKRWNNL